MPKLGDYEQIPVSGVIAHIQYEAIKVSTLRNAKRKKVVIVVLFYDPLTEYIMNARNPRRR